MPRSVLLGSMLRSRYRNARSTAFVLDGVETLMGELFSGFGTGSLQRSRLNVPDKARERRREYAVCATRYVVLLSFPLSITHNSLPFYCFIFFTIFLCSFFHSMAVGSLVKLSRWN
jgi:hypothetical protein